MRIFKNISLVILVLLYLLAGINHFVHPQGYISIIPHYIPAPVAANYLAGALEIILALLMIRPATRKVASWCIIIILGAFMPVHISMLLHAPMQVGSVHVTPALAWIRLFLQPVLMLWAWWHRK
ncbi:DoxX family protein [Mucilaginibacter sp.]|uniref:DoxX family protein n=1 Tax=Mucilaginibacter sp. TaxID=1882438 RepID=UPI000CAF7BC7|nr:DoxX family protein [Mucilaginibacter sp.]PLW88910.1 MAG: DoxX family protein [Mucilaginibacter sp.]HEK20584.1 DoxX family protein [Bacteroidota bacterium]